MMSGILALVLVLMTVTTTGATEVPEFATRLSGTIWVDHAEFPVFVDEWGGMLEPMVWRDTVYIPMVTAAEWMGCAWTLDGTVLRLTSGGEPYIRGLDNQPENYAPSFQAMIDACPVEADQRAEVLTRGEVAVELDGVPCPLINVLGEATPPIQCFGALYLPVRGVGEMMGKQVVWNLRSPEYHAIYLVDSPTGEELAELEGYLATITALHEELSGKLTALKANQASLTAEAVEARLRELDNLLDQITELGQPALAFGSYYRKLTQINLGAAQEDVDFLMAHLSGQNSLSGLSFEVFQERVDHIGRGLASQQSDLAALMETIKNDSSF